MAVHDQETGKEDRTEAEEEDKSEECGLRLLVLAIAVLVTVASTITLWKNSQYFHIFHISSKHRVVDKYADALGIALQFFDVQKCK